jgi:anti-sigma regulatory factor (Ser/Thr protein kinase)
VAAVQLNTMLRQTAEHHFPLPHIPGGVSVVRRRVCAVLAEWDLPPHTAHDALLVISELLTNAVIHALPPAALRLSFTPAPEHHALRIEVTDAGPVIAGAPAVDLEPEEHGRGISIIAALATRCGMHTHPGGITRWAELTTG